MSKKQKTALSKKDKALIKKTLAKAALQGRFIRRDDLTGLASDLKAAFFEADKPMPVNTPAKGYVRLG